MDAPDPCCSASASPRASLNFSIRARIRSALSAPSLELRRAHAFSTASHVAEVGRTTSPPGTGRSAAAILAASSASSIMRKSIRSARTGASRSFDRAHASMTAVYVLASGLILAMPSSPSSASADAFAVDVEASLMASRTSSALFAAFLPPDLACARTSELYIEASGRYDRSPVSRARCSRRSMFSRARDGAEARTAGSDERIIDSTSRIITYRS
mmetsp:Transcript_54946/g.164579  ORF Transcript_54946/g.164579 Transcript_54946/m.164579 type:complete len:215 (+) Transcript_54946:1501-2145(+)